MRSLAPSRSNKTIEILGISFDALSRPFLPLVLSWPPGPIFTPRIWTPGNSKEKVTLFGTLSCKVKSVLGSLSPPYLEMKALRGTMIIHLALTRLPFKPLLISNFLIGSGSTALSLTWCFGFKDRCRVPQFLNCALSHCRCLRVLAPQPPNGTFSFPHL